MDDGMDEEQVIVDKTEIDLNMDLIMINHKNDLEKDEIMDIQMKLPDVLIIKGTYNQPSRRVTWIFLLYWIYKRPVKIF